MKKTVLIFGASSFVGSNLVQFLKDDFRVLGTYNKTPVQFPGVTCFPCDVLKKDYVNKLLAIVRPDITIYAVGMSSVSKSMLAPKLADAVNSVGASNVSRASERVGSKFVYISSSFVLSGDDLAFKEGDIPMPETAYGSSMSSAEFYVQRSSINYLILRTCPLYGRSYNPLHANWFDVVQDALARGKPLVADSLVCTGYLDIAIFARILKGCLELNVTNRLLQVSSVDLLSRSEFAQLYAQIFKKDGSLIQALPKGLPLESGKKNVSQRKRTFRMDTSNIEQLLGAKLPKIEECLQFTMKRLGAKPSGKSF